MCFLYHIILFPWEEWPPWSFVCCVVRKEWANMVYKTNGLQANSKMVLKEVLLVDKIHFLKANPWETVLHQFQW